jgi:hypothetical protein
MTVFRRDGMLYMGSEAAGDGTDATPLVPEDLSYESLRFRVLDDGSETPMEFVVGENGAVSAILGRNVYHRLPAKN